ncbi:MULTISPECIES: nucleotidyltransferase domain-containing protein [unclassified Cyanobium]|uniref:nucleotidyltransferase domain-containing protein n=1 Tax=unclassified Cyanobium TaxID=2627006 RepID=UPI0020CFCA5D|nr:MULTISPECIES: nucleotidyltransferase domain-containing protein [unclassified Cyanobium]MCP9834620.1 nucleotidyltransferase domain-containing protein [Cyanobium sp. La Preciosa 7G6]MCP9937383.1 nucleotidyltransferase domain-containing protein [Cyanobium sp. Aljojuca 7A6]
MSPTARALATNTPAFSIEDRLAAMAREIQAVIPGAEVRLFGSWARGTARPDSDIDLLITVADNWLACHDRLQILGSIWRRIAHHRVAVDLQLYSQSQVAEKRHLSSHMIGHAYREGRFLDGNF